MYFEAFFFTCDIAIVNIYKQYLIFLGGNLGHPLPYVLVSSFVCCVAFFSICAWCFKKKKRRSSDDQEDGEDLLDYADQSNKPLLKHANNKSTPFPFLGLNSNNSNDLARSKSQPSLVGESPHHSPNHEMPGWGIKSLKFGAPPADASFESVGVQPKNKDLSQSYDSLVSSWSSIPAEPDAPTDRGEDLGSIYFSVSYDVYDLVLKLTIQKAVNLPAKDLSGTSDPFVKVLLLPDKKNKLETRVKRKKLNPVWNEVFTFEGFPHQKLVQRTLYLQVLDYDRFSRNDPIGEIELSLQDVHLQSEPVPFVKKLNPCKRSAVRVFLFLLMEIVYTELVTFLLSCLTRRINTRGIKNCFLCLPTMIYCCLPIKFVKYVQVGPQKICKFKMLLKLL